MIKFKTFFPGYENSAATYLTAWLTEHPYVELISWQATPVGSRNEVAITIQYREREEA